MDGMQQASNRGECSRVAQLLMRSIAWPLFELLVCHETMSSANSSFEYHVRPLIRLCANFLPCSRAPSPEACSFLFRHERTTRDRDLDWQKTADKLSYPTSEDDPENRRHSDPRRLVICWPSRTVPLFCCATLESRNKAYRDAFMEKFKFIKLEI